jgi:hypothetical protein
LAKWVAAQLALHLTLSKRKIGFWTAIALALVIAAAIIGARRDAGTDPSSGGSHTLSGKDKASADSVAADANLEAVPKMSASNEEKLLLQGLRQFLEDLRTAVPREEVRRRLAALKGQVHNADPAVAAAAIISALESGEDGQTGLSYVVGSEGVMAETPTYRTALLDLLGQTDPFRSAEYSRKLMSDTNSQDEYSLALRNLAWTNAHGRLDAELQDWFGAMLLRDEWRQSPTLGYLEAFDVATATGSLTQVADVIETLPDPVRDGEKLVGRAAFVALDRMMMADPSKVVESFLKDPALLAKSPVQRASIMSRLDLRNPEQKALLRDYLRRSDHAKGELAYFAEIFPNGNYLSSHRLITPWQSGLSMDQLAELDRITSLTLKAWMADPAFAGLKDHLQAVISRLDEFASEPQETSP